MPGFAAEAASADPGRAAAARDSSVLAHRVLSNLIGETFGYILTAVCRPCWSWSHWAGALPGVGSPHWVPVSALLVLAGVLSPLDLPEIDLANFVGYVLWSVWLVVFAILLLRRPRTPNAASVPARPVAERR